MAARSRLQLLRRQREAREAYIKSQAHEGWRLVVDKFDDGGLSGAWLERPALQALLDEVRSRKIDIIVAYKFDRLTRSLADFAKLVELFDAHDVSFVSVTQSFNTTSSMGRLTVNVLLSFAQFEREVIAKPNEAETEKEFIDPVRGAWLDGIRIRVPTGTPQVDRSDSGWTSGRSRALLGVGRRGRPSPHPAGPRPIAGSRW